MVQEICNGLMSVGACAAREGSEVPAPGSGVRSAASISLWGAGALLVVVTLVIIDLYIFERRRLAKLSDKERQDEDDMRRW